MSSLAPTPAIELHSIHYVYAGGERALNGVSLRVETGSSYALMGPNGGGKSTLFRLLTTLARPTEGKVKIFGTSVDNLSTRKRIGIVFQNPALDPKLTVKENLWCQASLYSIPRREREARIAEWLTVVGLADRAGESVSTLSGGLKRRLEIARACLVEPELLLMDEPTSGLDPRARREIWELIGKLQRRRGMTLFFTTHLIEEAQRADQVVFMDEGKIVVAGSPTELRSQLGGDVLSVLSDSPDSLLTYLNGMGLEAKLTDGEVRLETDRAGEVIEKILAQFKAQVRNLSLGKPTLADLFFQKTGRRYAEVQ